MMEFNQFKWVDTFAYDFEASKQFYSEMFGWQFTDQFNGDQLVYSLATLNLPDNRTQGPVVAGVGPCHIPKSEGNPWHWGVYILVENLESTIEVIVERGGNVCKEPMEVMDAGRMAVCADSVGAIFHLWQPMAHFGAGIEKVPGAYCWFELISSDLNKSEDFYSNVFGWKVVEVSQNGASYREFRLDDVVIGGMHNHLEITGGLELWLPYFQSSNLDPQIETCQRRGGSVVTNPVSVPGIGRYAVVSDQEHNMFGIAELI